MTTSTSIATQGSLKALCTDDAHVLNASFDTQVASYEFTTLTCIPGVVRYRGAKIQLLDLPGIIEGAKDGKGRGRQVRVPALLPALICPGPSSTPLLVTHVNSLTTGIS